jgi:hypothetical protein
MQTFSGQQLALRVDQRTRVRAQDRDIGFQDLQAGTPISAFVDLPDGATNNLNPGVQPNQNPGGGAIPPNQNPVNPNPNPNSPDTNPPQPPLRNAAAAPGPGAAALQNPNAATAPNRLNQSGNLGGFNLDFNFNTGVVVGIVVQNQTFGQTANFLGTGSVAGGFIGGVPFYGSGGAPIAGASSGVAAPFPPSRSTEPIRATGGKAASVAGVGSPVIGRVVKVTPDANLFTFKTTEENPTELILHINDKSVIKLHDKKATLEDLKAGMELNVVYHIEGEKNLVDEIGTVPVRKAPAVPDDASDKGSPGSKSPPKPPPPGV